MYELKDTPFGNLKNVVVYGTSHPVGHVLHTVNGYSLWERGLEDEGDELIADVAGWEHGLSVWKIYAAF